MDMHTKSKNLSLLTVSDVISTANTHTPSVHIAALVVLSIAIENKWPSHCRSIAQFLNE